MKQITFKTILGSIGIMFGVLGMVLLIFFYSTVLFSNAWPELQSLHKEFRLLFSVSTGIIAMYAFFLILFIPCFAVFCLGAWFGFNKKCIGKHMAFIVACLWVLALLFGLLTTLHQAKKIVERIDPFSGNPIVFDMTSEIPLPISHVFKTTLKNEVRAKRGVPVEGYEPSMFLEVFPGLTETDFENVEASIGRYTIEGGRLIHQMGNAELIHSAAKSVTDRGIETLLMNVSIRLGIDLSTDGTITEVMEALIMSPQQKAPQEEVIQATPVFDDQRDIVACTMDAKICPDGSAVGRQGPNCEFAACPVSLPTTPHICTPSEKAAKACTMHYEPVCGLVEVQCITTPCNPVPQTFGNACSACSQDAVVSYTQGECSL